MAVRVPSIYRTVWFAIGWAPRRVPQFRSQLAFELARNSPVRVTGGSLLGRRLLSPPAEVRPTSDRVREALFARLGILDGSRVLDLFAGAGTLGIEALSRGAQEAVFVERSNKAVSVLRKNLEQLGLSERSRILQSEVQAALKLLKQPGGGGGRFDLVLLDPPYAEPVAARLLEELVRLDLLAPTALLVVESGKRHPVPAVPGLSLLDERRYGDTLISRFEVTRAFPGGDRPSSEQRED